MILILVGICSLMFDVSCVRHDVTDLLVTIYLQFNSNEEALSNLSTAGYLFS